ncbi:MAG: hypothetical protein ACI4NO_08180 [Oxalobacter sp.]
MNTTISASPPSIPSAIRATLTGPFASVLPRSPDDRYIGDKTL